MQFYEADLPKVSQKKIDLVNAVIPDKEKVRCRVLTDPHHTCAGSFSGRVILIPLRDGPS